MKNTTIWKIIFNQKNQLINFFEKEKSGPSYINSGHTFKKRKNY